MKLSYLMPAVVPFSSMAFDEFLPSLPPLSQAFQFPTSSGGSAEASNTPPMSKTPQIEPFPSSEKETESETAEAFRENEAHRTSATLPMSSKQRVSRRVSRRVSDAPPRVCLAFLSCCGRTDLLERTLLAAVAHMEIDEPTIPYEVAWVDNGSPGAIAVASRLGVSAALTPTGENALKSTASNTRSYQNSDLEQNSAPMVDHVWLAEENLGLAWGLNTLFFDLCTAPFVLSLEEDWMYMDHTVAIQTPARRNAVSLALQVASSNVRSFDGRDVYGVFLRPETYDSFLKPPHVGPWQQLVPYDQSEGFTSSSSSSSLDPSASSPTAAGEYRVYCADVSGDSSYVWGSYTNGAALYNRSALYNSVGRFFGEPGDGFHESYTEANYAYRAARRHCHALLRLEPACPNALDGCNAAFYHVGGGRSTRPSALRHLKAPDPSWALYGTPAYAASKRASEEEAAARQAMKEKAALRAGATSDRSSSSSSSSRSSRSSSSSNMNTATSWTETRAAYTEYQEQVASANAAVFAREAAAREDLRAQARALRHQAAELAAAATNNDKVESWTDAEYRDFLDQADQLDARADSPHPLPGFWDGMGKPIEGEPLQASIALNRVKSSAEVARPEPAEMAARAADLLAQANLLRQLGPAEAKKQVPSWRELSDKAVMAVAETAERLANDRSALALILQAEQEQQQDQDQDQEPSLPPQEEVPRSTVSNDPRVKAASTHLPTESGTISQKKTVNRQVSSRPIDETSHQTKKQKKSKEKKSEELRATRRSGAQQQQQQQQQQQPAKNKVAATWAQVAHDYERTGRRAFTGIGYQEQYRRVQELMKAYDKNKTSRKTPWQVLMRAIYGPGFRL